MKTPQKSYLFIFLCDYSCHHYTPTTYLEGIEIPLVHHQPTVEIGTNETLVSVGGVLYKHLWLFSEENLNSY